MTSFDSIWRINPDGDVDDFFKGLGRPQGLAFDREGNLYVAAALRGRRGIVRISPDGSDARVVVAGVNLIGLAFSASGEMAVVSIDSVYSLPTQIKGTLLPGASIVGGYLCAVSPAQSAQRQNAKLTALSVLHFINASAN